ncbi:phasin family protein [Chthonobacter rhizosphaerae]|uniref:phasin family protein n=1 Tax=Chthonobacter rhizosphaerae TaxID=2735553 RepID=UPI0015EE99A7|nr:phasin family protein [Chthonobacter rhizosphaerae]
MPTSKPPKILFGSEAGAPPSAGDAEGAAGDAAGSVVTLLNQASAGPNPMAAGLGEAAHAASDAMGAAASAARDAAGRAADQAAGDAASSDAFSFGLDTMAGAPRVFGEVSRLWGDFARRQMTRTMEGFAEAARCRTPMDMVALQQRLVQETMRDCTELGLDMATAPMRGLSSPSTVCRP